MGTWEGVAGMGRWGREEEVIHGSLASNRRESFNFPKRSFPLPWN
jgi:hypothetical protein